MKRKSLQKEYFRLLKFFDWTSFAFLMSISLIGLLFVLSATYTPEQPFSPYFYKQLFGICSGVLIFWTLSFFNYKTTLAWGIVLFTLTMALLVFTLVKGSIGMGAQRWINLGIIKFQPSELTKLFFPAFFIFCLDTENPDRRFRHFLPILAILGISFILILKQPDLGTALIIMGSGMLLLWVANIGKTFFITMFLLSAICAPIAWGHLKPYQQQRVIVFLGGGSSQKERYQIEQSQIAIGSGGLFGKGYLRGTQNKFNFLPESRTDFIFSVIGEELGFIGASLVLLLFCLLFLSILARISVIPFPSAQLMALGLIAPLMVSTIVNIAMVLGLLPAVGIPLPFITYGITHVWVGFASLGWYNSIVAHTAQLPLGAPPGEAKNPDHLLLPPE